MNKVAPEQIDIVNRGMLNECVETGIIALGADGYRV